VTFSDPVEIILSYDNLREDYELMTLDNPSDATWEIVEGADCTSGECIADVTSFGLYSVIEVVDNEYVEGCTDESACNYDANANVDNGSCLQLDCTGECGGPAEIDECGLCEGEGIDEGACDCFGSLPEENYDCDGNELLTNDSFTPTEFKLLPNFPNPFNPKTTIQYSLPKYSEVLIQIYNSNGILVADLVNTSIQPGEYSVDWDASNYASGIYFVKMIAGDYLQNQKLILIK
jgi:hypothetical protein